MTRYEIREICGDWAIWQQYETDQGGEEKILLILNSRSNAEYVKAILEHEAKDPNAAVPYRPEVAQMSDAECVAVNRLCCTGGHQCHACPFSGSESLEETCFEVERRVLEMAEKYLEWRKEDVVRCKDCEFAIEEDENVYTCEAYVGGYNSGQTFCSYGKRREGGAE